MSYNQLILIISDHLISGDHYITVLSGKVRRCSAKCWSIVYYSAYQNFIIMYLNTPKNILLHNMKFKKGMLPLKKLKKL